MAIEDVLVREGLVSAQAVDHAREVQKRGFSGHPIDELLVDLEYLDELDLARFVASNAGVGVWSGEQVEPSQLGVPYRAVVVRHEGGTVYYAAMDPLDEELKQLIRFGTQARELVPLVATRTMMADARVWQDVSYETEEAVRRLRLAPDEARLRTRWKAGVVDEADVEMTNTYLFMCCREPGRRLVMRTNPPYVAVGRHGAMRRLRSSAETTPIALYRLAHMSGADVGPGFRMGRLKLNLGAGRGAEMRVTVATTRQGESLRCQRVIPYAGRPELAVSDIAEILQARERAESVEREIELLKTALEYTQDPTHWLDRVFVLEQLGHTSNYVGRPLEAKAYLEQGMQLLGERGVRGRAHLGFLDGLANAEVSDAERRAALFARTHREARNGAARSFDFVSMFEEVSAWMYAERYDKAETAARQLMKADRAVFGAVSAAGAAAMGMAAEALAFRGDIPGARQLLTELEEAWCPPDQWRLEYARGKVAVAAEQHHEAVTHLRAAFELPHADLIRVAAALASSLVAVGKTNEAIGVARGVADAPPGIFDHRERAILERIRNMSPYR